MVAAKGEMKRWRARRRRRGRLFGNKRERKRENREGGNTPFRRREPGEGEPSKLPLRLQPPGQKLGDNPRGNSQSGGGLPLSKCSNIATKIMANSNKW